MNSGLPICTWERSVASDVKNQITSKSPSKGVPFMIAIAGIPGSGKSTSSHILSEILKNEFHLRNVVIPMDGYHYPLKVLQTFDNSADVIYRRGAEDTFDSEKLFKTLMKIRLGPEDTIYIPGFDHTKGDPEKDIYKYQRSEHPVIICEGLYLLHWQRIRQIFDYTVFIDANVDACISRLKVRNQCIPGYTKEEIEIRCEEVDRANAMVVLKSKEYANIVVQSLAL
jgi:pantothenate kinase